MSPIPTVSYEDVLEQMEENGTNEASFVLEEGISAWHPASTKRNVWGPAKITYVKFPEQMVATVEDL